MPASKYCFGFESLFQRQSIVTSRPILSIIGVLNDADIDIGADADEGTCCWCLCYFGFDADHGADIGADAGGDTDADANAHIVSRFETLFQHRMSIVTSRPRVSINGVLNDADIGVDADVDADTDAHANAHIVSDLKHYSSRVRHQGANSVNQRLKQQHYYEISNGPTPYHPFVSSAPFVTIAMFVTSTIQARPFYQHDNKTSDDATKKRRDLGIAWFTDFLIYQFTRHNF